MVDSNLVVVHYQVTVYHKLFRFFTNDFRCDEKPTVKALASSYIAMRKDYKEPYLPGYSKE